MYGYDEAQAYRLGQQLGRELNSWDGPVQIYPRVPPRSIDHLHAYVLELRSPRYCPELCMSDFNAHWF